MRDARDQFAAYCYLIDKSLHLLGLAWFTYSLAGQVRELYGAFPKAHQEGIRTEKSR